MVHLIVEDGTGKEDSNSYVSLTFANLYWDRHGYDVSSYTDEQKEAALIRATQYLSESFAWQGYRVYGRNDVKFQAQAWPRDGVTDREGILVENDVVPREVQWATCEVGFFELGNPHGLKPTYEEYGQVRKEKAGPVEITYELGSYTTKGASAARPILIIVQDLIAEYLETGAGVGSNVFGTLVGTSVRG